MNKIIQALHRAEIKKLIDHDAGALSQLDAELTEMFRKHYHRVDVPEIQRRVRSLDNLPDNPPPGAHYLNAFGVGGVMRYPIHTGEVIYKIPVFSFAMGSWKDHWTTVYLIKGNNALTLVDTGSHQSEETMREGFRVIRELYGEDFELEDVTHVILTHAHFDHFGGLSFVIPATNAKILVHDWDAHTISDYPDQVVKGREKIARFLAQSGMPEDEQTNFMHLHGEPKKLFSGYKVDQAFQCGDRLLDAYEVLHTPGHCPGLSVIKVGDILLLGDQVLNRVTPHQFPKIFTEGSGLLNYLNSLIKVSYFAEDVRLGLPSHYGDIHNIEGRTMEIIAEHNLRIADLIKDSDKPKNLYQITEDYYHFRRGRELAGYEKLMALEEIGAHVEYMQETLGMMRLVNPSALEDPHEALLYERSF